MIFEDDARARRSDAVLSRQVLDDEFPCLARICDGDMDQEVVNTADEEQLQHLRQSADGFRERRNAALARAWAERDADDRLKPPAETVVVDAGMEAGNDSAVDERAQPSVTCGCRDAETRGELGIRHPTVGGQQLDEPEVSVVQPAPRA